MNGNKSSSKIDFIEELKQDIIKAHPDINELWAEICALIPLATVIPEALIHDKEGPLHLNIYALGVGPAGIKKSLPLFQWTFQLILRTGKLVGKDFLLPNRSSVPGFIDFVSKQDEHGNYIRNQGAILRDEFTGWFREMRDAHWQNDALEFISEMYDGTAQKRMTLSHGLKNPPMMYVNILSATTFDFTNVMDDRFYKQGTGNRILYVFFDPEKYIVSKIDPVDYFREENRGDYESLMEKYSKTLEKTYRRNIRSIGMDPDAAALWAEFKHKCDLEWHTKLRAEPNGWSFHPIRRYPEYALKLSGIYSVSEFIESQVPEIVVTEKAMRRAISLVEKCGESFRNIVKMKTTYKPQKKVESIFEQAKTELMKLASAPDGMMNLRDWYASMDTTKNRNEKLELKEFSKLKGWVQEFEYSELSSEQREKYGITNAQAHAVRYLKGLQ